MLPGPQAQFLYDYEPLDMWRGSLVVCSEPYDQTTRRRKSVDGFLCFPFGFFLKPLASSGFLWFPPVSLDFPGIQEAIGVTFLTPTQHVPTGGLDLKPRFKLLPLEDSVTLGRKGWPPWISKIMPTWQVKRGA